MKRFLTTLALSLSLAGCSYGLDKRAGPEPILDAATVEAASTNRLRILTAFARDAHLTVDHPSYWYLVAESGFNHVEDECRSYFNQLFFLNRDRERVKGALGSTSAATAAILAATGAPASSIAVVAQAFGLGLSATDLAAGAYLYQLPPSATRGFVRELQIAYREGAAARRELISSAPAAYQAIQGFLDLCLPSTIEAKIAEHLSSARALPDPTGRTRGSTFGITVVGVQAPPRTAFRSVEGGIRSPGGLGGRASAGVDRSGSTSGRRIPEREASSTIPGIERVLVPTLAARADERTLRRVQEALCVPSPERGQIGPLTEALIDIFEDQHHRRRPSLKDGKLDDPEIALLRGQGGCRAGGPRNYFEQTQFGDSGPGRAALTQLLVQLGGAPPASGPPTFAMVEALRGAIRAKRREFSGRINPVPSALEDHMTRDLFSVLTEVKS